MVVYTTHFSRILAPPLPHYTNKLSSSSLLNAQSTNAQVFNMLFLKRTSSFLFNFKTMIIAPMIFFLRYFKRSENVKKVRTYIELCSRGDWFVLYQLSKNLNRPFFMDFLVTLARTGRIILKFEDLRT